ncbi:Phenylalanine--tRNA ligase beta subunit [Trichinella pseudospiralis]
MKLPPQHRKNVWKRNTGTKGGASRLFEMQSTFEMGRIQPKLPSVELTNASKLARARFICPWGCGRLVLRVAGDDVYGYSNNELPSLHLHLPGRRRLAQRVRGGELERMNKIEHANMHNRKMHA